MKDTGVSNRWWGMSSINSRVGSRDLKSSEDINFRVLKAKIDSLTEHVRDLTARVKAIEARQNDDR